MTEGNGKKVFFGKVLRSNTNKNYFFKVCCSDMDKLMDFRDEVYYDRKDVIV